MGLFSKKSKSTPLHHDGNTDTSGNNDRGAGGGIQDDHDVPFNNNNDATPTPHTTAGAPVSGKKFFSFNNSTSTATKEDATHLDQNTSGATSSARNGQPGGTAVVPMLRGPPRVNDIAGAIGYSCASSTFDYTYILALCDHISLSVNASKEAAKALKREVKYSDSAIVQERAIRLMGIMCRNSDTRFKQQIASKKFLGELMDLASNKKTEPAVLTMLLRVLSPLAYDYQRDAELNSITTLYNRLKSPNAHTNGEPLEPTDLLFTPTAPPQSQSHRSVPHHQRRGGGRSGYGIGMSKEEEMKMLQREANEAKGNARMLVETLAFTPDEGMGGNELVAEFYAKCFDSQERLVGSLEWAASQAEQSRRDLPSDPMPHSDNPVSSPTSPFSNTTTTPAPSEQLSQTQTPISPLSNQSLNSRNPFAPIIQQQEEERRLSLPRAVEIPGGKETTRRTESINEEELTYSMLLSAHSDITDALHLHSDRMANSLDLQNLKLGEERSVAPATQKQSQAQAEARSPFSDQEEGGYEIEHDLRNEYPGSGEGGSGLPRDTSRHEEVPSSGSGKGKAVARMSSGNPYRSTSSSTPEEDTRRTVPHDLLSDEPEEGDEMFDSFTTPVLNPISGAGGGREGLGRRATNESEASVLLLKEPSDKAFGKLRRVSIREDDADGSDLGKDPQAELEAALREKYRREFEEKEARAGNR